MLRSVDFAENGSNSNSDALKMDALFTPKIINADFHFTFLTNSLIKSIVFIHCEDLTKFEMPFPCRNREVCAQSISIRQFYRIAFHIELGYIHCDTSRIYLPSNKRKDKFTIISFRISSQIVFDLDLFPSNPPNYRRTTLFHKVYCCSIRHTKRKPNIIMIFRDEWLLTISNHSIARARFLLASIVYFPLILSFFLLPFMLSFLSIGAGLCFVFDDKILWDEFTSERNINLIFSATFYRQIAIHMDTRWTLVSVETTVVIASYRDERKTWTDFPLYP